MTYFLSRNLDCSYDEAVSRVREALAAEGFGVLTEIDVQATLKKKLDVAFRPYVILGACNPPFAYRALQAERNVGLLLPCNVVVQQAADGTAEVSAIDPEAAMAAVDNQALQPVAAEIKAKLAAVLDAL